MKKDFFFFFGNRPYYKREQSPTFKNYRLRPIKPRPTKLVRSHRTIQAQRVCLTVPNDSVDLNISVEQEKR